MQAGQPSRTARLAAAHRAAHQVLEQGRIFSDPLALRILGTDADTIVRTAQSDPSSRRMRLFIAARTRFAEDSFARAFAQRARQLVVLGAGLDTFAYRHSYGPELRVFEVDHPATQTWKRQQLATLAIAIPNSLTYTPIDFESETLSAGLGAAGFDFQQQAFFTWLGVVPYLTASAMWSTLEFIASLQRGVHVVFDYSNPPDMRSELQQELHQQRAAKVAALGEAWVNYLHTPELHSRLAQLGFKQIEDLGPKQIATRFFPSAASAAPESGGHILRAATTAS